jgi:hypothetical protein
MAWLVQKLAPKLGLDNPLSGFDYYYLLMHHYWTDYYFLDDLSGTRYIAADANIFPFWLGLITDKRLVKLAVNTVENQRLAQPFPIKYTYGYEARMLWYADLAEGYERNAIWTHMGPLYIAVVDMVDKRLKQQYLRSYRAVIEHYRNYLEVFDEKGKPFERTLYMTDEGMIWCANYLVLTK